MTHNTINSVQQQQQHSHRNIFTTPRSRSPTLGSSSYKFKIVLLGESNAGKTAFRKRLMYDQFDRYAHEPTLGIDIGVRTVESDNATSTVQVWDTSGNPRFENLLYSYCRHSQGAILFFNCADRASFVNVAKWMSFFHRENVLGVKRTKLLLVATNCDSTKRIVQSNEAIQFARANDMLYSEFDASSMRQRQTCETLEQLVIAMIANDDKDSLSFESLEGKAKPSVFAPVVDTFAKFYNKYFNCSAPVQTPN